MSEVVEGVQEMSDRLKVAVVLDYASHAEKRQQGECWRRCGSNFCDCLGCYDTLFNRYAVFLPCMV